MTVPAGTTWRPILHGEEAAAARRAVAEIAGALAAEVQLVDPVETASAGPAALAAAAPAALGHDLADGAAGIALLFGYRAAVEHDDRDAELARDLLARAGDQLAEAPTPPSLFHGFTGVAWAADHVAARLGELDLADNAEIDATLIDWLGGAADPGCGFDLVTGLVGLGVYALERRGHPPADRCAALVVARLAGAAHRDDDGRVWWTAPGAPAAAAARETQAAPAPHGALDFGLAHGVPGVIALLARCAALGGPTGEAAAALVPGAVRWLLAQRTGGETVWPATLAPGRPPAIARSAWCYGDAAAASALVRAAAAAGDPAWRASGLAIARRAAHRPLPDTRVRDATLCHGAAALALIYQRLYAATGDAELLAAARAWTLRILAYRTAGAFPAAAGFYRATLREPVADRGLLNGAAGIGLVLLAATSELAPDWDRALLLG